MLLKLLLEFVSQARSKAEATILRSPIAAASELRPRRASMWCQNEVQPPRPVLCWFHLRPMALSSIQSSGPSERTMSAVAELTQTLTYKYDMHMGVAVHLNCLAYIDLISH